MKPHCKQILETHLAQVVAALIPGTTAVDARKQNVISQADYELILHNVTLPTKDQKNLKLVDILKEKDAGWTFLIEHLRQQGKTSLATTLMQLEAKSRPKSIKLPAPQLPNRMPQTGLATTLFSTMHEKLKAKIHNKADGVFGFWRRLLPNVDFSAAYVEVEILTEQRTAAGKLSGFSYLWNTPGKRILLEGEPGTGKTVYAHQIALAWTQSNSELSKHFDFVFLLSLHDIQQKCTSLEHVLQLYLFDQESREDVPKLLQGTDGKHDRLLFILDGFDEFDQENCEDILKLLKMERLQTATVLFTSRYLADILDAVGSYRRLCINGFTDEQAAAFIAKQSPASPGNTEKNVSPNMKTMQNNPLLLAIWCVLSRENATQLFDLTKSSGYFDMIVLFEKHLVNRYRKSRECINGDVLQQVKEYVGKLAWQQISRQSPYRLVMFQGIKQTVHENSATLKAVATQMGFLVQEVDSGGQEYERFQHQIFAEYFAATYLCTVTSSLEITSANRDHLIWFFTSPTSYFLSGMSSDYTVNTVLKKCINLTMNILPDFHLPWIVVPHSPDQTFLDILHQCGLPGFDIWYEQPVCFIVKFPDLCSHFTFDAHYNSSAMQPPYFVSASEQCQHVGGDWIVHQESNGYAQCGLAVPPLVTNHIGIACLHFIGYGWTLDLNVDDLVELRLQPTCSVCWRSCHVGEKVECLLAKAVKLTQLFIGKFAPNLSEPFFACISAMKNCRQLSSIMFAECYFDPEASRHFLQLLRDFVGQKLTSLVFYDCASLSNISLSGLQYCTRLQKLCFSDITKFTSNADTIAQAFASFASTLHTLALLDCDGAGLSTDLMKNISLLRSLKVLTTMKIDFTPETVGVLLLSLQSLPDLLYLELRADKALGRNRDLLPICARLQSLQVANFQRSLSSIERFSSLDFCRTEESAKLHLVVSPNVVGPTSQADIATLVQRFSLQNIEVHLQMDHLPYSVAKDKFGLNLDFAFH